MRPAKNRGEHNECKGNQPACDSHDSALGSSTGYLASSTALNAKTFGQVTSTTQGYGPRIFPGRRQDYLRTRFASPIRKQVGRGGQAIQVNCETPQEEWPNPDSTWVRLLLCFSAGCKEDKAERELSNGSSHQPCPGVQTALATSFRCL